MIIPQWALFAFAASLIITAIPLLQEKMKANGFSVAFIIKIVTVLTMLPFVIRFGLPDSPAFYAFVFSTAVLYSISDVVYYRSVPEVGAGVVTRLLPASVIITFLAWFLFEPSLFEKYLSKPLESSLIAGIILASAYFATRLKKCPISWNGVKKIAFVIFAASLGPILQKLTLEQGITGQAVYGYVFIQALMMLSCWCVYYAIKRPVPLSVLFAPLSLKTGAMIGLFSASSLVLKSFAYLTVEHPAFIPIILFTDSIWVLLIYRLMGRKDDSDIWAGLGIVACAAGLVLVKSLY